MRSLYLGVRGSGGATAPMVPMSANECQGCQAHPPQNPERKGDRRLRCGIYRNQLHLCHVLLSSVASEPASCAIEQHAVHRSRGGSIAGFFREPTQGERCHAVLVCCPGVLVTVR